MLDISKNIDKFNLEILIMIKEIADNLHIDFFIVGATVRDMILNYAYGIQIYRSTNDIDFAVRVKNWEDYNLLISEIEKAGLAKTDRIKHRYTYKGMILDFIPFGSISTKENTIRWSNDKDDKEMNVIGFDDAFMNTKDLLIQTEPGIIIKAASVESLAMLKIIAWNDRTIDTRIKDARDLYLIMTTYLQAGNEERLFKEHTDIIEMAIDYELSGARLLGRDIARTASDKVNSILLEILNDNKLNKLADEMSQYDGLSFEKDETKDKCLALLINLLMGLEDNK